jgi:hypothetical protein
MALPSIYSSYTIIRREQLLANQECQNVKANIERSSMSGKWKQTAIALACPFFYLKNSEYLINIDADDCFMPYAEYYINAAISVIQHYNLPTLSYDYIYSYNLFDDNRNILPNHWSFGINVSHTNRMKNDLNNIINNIGKYSTIIPRINIQQECNLDILFTAFLKSEGMQYKYHSFITKEGLMHLGFPNFELYSCLYKDGNFHSKFKDKTFVKPLHPKTLFIE